MMKARANYQYQNYDSRYAYIRTLNVPQFVNEYPEEVPADEQRHHITFAQILVNEDYVVRILHLNKKMVHEIGLSTEENWHIPLISEIPEEEIIERTDDTTIAVSKDYARKILKTLPVKNF